MSGKIPLSRHIADLHLGHQKVSELRGFDSVAEHDETILEMLYRVPVTAPLYLQGDLSAGSASAEAHAYTLLEPLIRERTGPTTLVLGNHDRAHPAHRNGRRHLRAAHQLFDAVLMHDQIHHDGQVILLSHFPYVGDHIEDRDLSQWHLRNRGELLIHGHLHASHAVHADRPKQVCVSYEALGDFGGQVPTIQDLLNVAQQARDSGLWQAQTNYAVHPGEHLIEYLQDNEISIETAAYLARRTVEQVQALTEPTTVIGTDEARILSRITDIPPSRWLALQRGYVADLYRLAKNG